MSHSKMTKRGRSHYVEGWNPSAKKYINVCKVCGHTGYKPLLDSPNFDTTPPNGAIREELTQILQPLPLDEFGRCPQCAKVLGEK